jgi:hypothetical protein
MQFIFTGCIMPTPTAAQPMSGVITVLMVLFSGNSPDGFLLLGRSSILLDV